LEFAVSIGAVNVVLRVAPRDRLLRSQNQPGTEPRMFDGVSIVGCAELDHALTLSGVAWALAAGAARHRQRTDYQYR
jgi:hypothetical protein